MNNARRDAALARAGIKSAMSLQESGGDGKRDAVWGRTAVKAVPAPDESARNTKREGTETKTEAEPVKSGGQLQQQQTRLGEERARLKSLQDRRKEADTERGQIMARLENKATLTSQEVSELESRRMAIMRFLQDASREELQAEERLLFLLECERDLLSRMAGLQASIESNEADIAPGGYWDRQIKEAEKIMATARAGIEVVKVRIAKARELLSLLGG